jgi:hypothetical protein
MFTYPESAVGFIQTHFDKPYYFQGDATLNKNIMPDLPSSLQTADAPRHCIPIFTQVLDECRIYAE